MATERDEEEVWSLLELFLFGPASFRGDRYALQALTDRDPPLEATCEHERRLIRWFGGKELPHPGVRWVLDLLPTFPRQAIAAIQAYLLADWQHLPDGRVDGLEDAAELIRARYIGAPRTAEARRLVFFELSSRQFETLVHRLYEAMGYKAELTRPHRDGGRDVLATHVAPGRRETLRIECKLHASPVGVRHARALLGVVADEKANRGVMVSAGTFTRDARDLAKRNPRLELVNGRELVTLLNEHIGGDWPTRLEWLLSPRRGPV